MDGEPLYRIYLIGFYLAPLAAAIILRLLKVVVVPFRILTLLFFVPVLAGASAYASIVYLLAQQRPAEMFITVMLTTFLFTIVPDGIWSVLFGQVAWLWLNKCAVARPFGSRFVIIGFVGIGALTGVGFCFIDRSILAGIAHIYSLTEPPLKDPANGPIGFALGGAVMGFITVQGWAAYHQHRFA